MSRLRRLLVLSVLLLGFAAALQAAPAPATDNASTNDLNKGRATIDPNG